MTALSAPRDRRLHPLHDTCRCSRPYLYGLNPHGDTETLTDPETGQATATYRYTGYGSTDKTGTTGVDKPGTQTEDIDQVNPYRFNSKRYDSATDKYDMGFRNYDPGLNRFLTRDMYNGALDDLALGTDPWNANRYAFAGGNPIAHAELDGHMLLDTGGGGGGGSAAEENRDAVNFYTTSVVGGGSSRDAGDHTVHKLLGADGRGVRIDAELQEGYVAPPVTAVRPLLGRVFAALRGGSKQGATPEPLIAPGVAAILSGEGNEDSRRCDGTEDPYYQPLDPLGRATGAIACLTRVLPTELRAGGRRATPKGFVKDVHERSHLIGHRFGGKNSIENIVPLYIHANQSIHKRQENRVAAELSAGHTVLYSVTVDYEIGTLIPTGLGIDWYSSSGHWVSLPVPNLPSSP